MKALYRSGYRFSDSVRVSVLLGLGVSELVTWESRVDRFTYRFGEKYRNAYRFDFRATIYRLCYRFDKKCYRFDKNGTPNGPCSPAVHCAAFPLYGTGQGSGNFAVIWVFISSVLFTLHEKQAHGATFVSPDGETTVHLSMVGFVDDSTSRTNDFTNPTENLQHIIDATQADAQLWNDLLWISGGLLEIAKCSYHLLTFLFHSNRIPFPQAGTHGPPL
jgi:hypothetical protein